MIDSKQFEKRMQELVEFPDILVEELLPIVKKETPIRSGNARRKTKQQRNQIKSDYPYAGRLNDGWSKQAPKGFIEPSLKQLDRVVEKQLRKI